MDGLPIRCSCGLPGNAHQLRLRFAEVDNVAPFNLGVDNVDFTAAAIPWPSSWIMVFGSLLGVAFIRRRRD